MDTTPEPARTPDVLLPGELLADCNLSAKALGVYAHLARLADAHVTVRHLVDRVADGEASVKSALRELEVAGYLTRQPVRDGRGLMRGMEYVLHAARRDRTSGDQGERTA